MQKIGEALVMRWLTRGLIQISIIGIILFLALALWMPASPTHAQQVTLQTATPDTNAEQATPTMDATVTALNKELLTQQVTQQRYTWENWLWSNAATVLSSVLSSLVIIIGVLIGFGQWSVSRKDTQSKESEDRRTAQEKELKNQQDEREKRAEERFQAAVEGLSSEREEARIGAAVLLRTFLRPGYEQFYTQTFDLAVAHLRLPGTSEPSEAPDMPLPLTPLRQALIAVFKEAFPLVRNFYPDGGQLLAARGIRLDSGYLENADLQHVWMPQASLREADLSGADLKEATLSGAWLRRAILQATRLNNAHCHNAHLEGANLRKADLSGADFHEASFHGAKLYKAHLEGTNLEKTDLGEADLSEARLHNAHLYQAHLEGTNLYQAHLEGANLGETNFKRANLNGANLHNAILFRSHLEGVKLAGVDLSGARLNGASLSKARLDGANFYDADLSGADLSQTSLRWTHPESARSLKETKLRQVKGLTEEQLITCKAKGAIIDEVPINNASQPTTPPPSLPQNDSVRVSAPSVQEME